MGLTGECLKRKTIIYSNDVTDNPYFNENLDNLLEVKNLKNFIVFEVGSFNNVGGGKTD